jgi:hypothetical protein
MDMAEGPKTWTVGIVGRAVKQKCKLPVAIVEALEALFLDLRDNGPQRANWPNFGRLHRKKNEEYYHCHLNRGKPRYVAVWRVTDRAIKLMEIRYVGTHEGADYQRID